jgi:uncharacterized membrane protein
MHTGIFSPAYCRCAVKIRYLGLAFVFVWFFAGGIGHFALTDYFLRIVPPYVPFPLAAVYVSGVFELIGAMAILMPRTRALAGIGLIVLTICVTPANIYMWMHPQLFRGISETLLGARLFIQVLLIACIWWATQPLKNADVV